MGKQVESGGNAGQNRNIVNTFHPIVASSAIHHFGLKLCFFNCIQEKPMGRQVERRGKAGAGEARGHDRNIINTLHSFRPGSSACLSVYTHYTHYFSA